MLFEVYAYDQNGRRQVVTSFTGSVNDEAVAKGFVQAKLRGEYVDVFRDGVNIATCGPNGRFSEDDTSPLEGATLCGDCQYRIEQCVCKCDCYIGHDDLGPGSCGACDSDGNRLP